MRTPLLCTWIGEIAATFRKISPIPELYPASARCLHMSTNWSWRPQGKGSVLATTAGDRHTR